MASAATARLVYLSACSTAEIKDNKLRDEGLHITSAFQIAGFPHAIGSLWSADDEICVKVADAFYNNLTEGGSTPVFLDSRVAQALRAAVLSLQSQYKDDPSIWAQFVHFGA
jgi:CHAT domain-containing protein